MTNQPDSTLVARVLESIQKMILSGELAPGEYFSQRKLAEKCRASFSTTAAALRLLALDGIIISQPRRGGSRVALTSLEDLWGILQLRLAIEHRAVVLACEYATDADFDKMTEYGKRADSFVITNPAEAGRADYEFHRQLLMASHSEAFVHQANIILTYMIKQRTCPALIQYPPTILPDPAKGDDQPTCGHVELTQMIADRDVTAAMNFLELHVTSTLGHPLLSARAQRSMAIMDHILHGTPLVLNDLNQGMTRYRSAEGKIDPVYKNNHHL